MNNCLNCNKETANPKFCSRHCSVSFNNRKTPRRKPEGKCKICNTAIRSKLLYCKKCYKKHYRTDWSTVTYGELTHKRKYQKNSRIRSLARAKYLKSDKPQKCMFKGCEYDKHFEVTHIRQISDFPKTATITEINALDNLAALCPNHHWEEHANIWSMSEIFKYLKVVLQ